MNTLFLNFFAAQSEFSIGCAEEIIKSAFKAVPECHYILLCAPISIVPEPALSALFIEMKRINDTDANSKQNSTLFIVNRDQFIPVLHIRDAK